MPKEKPKVNIGQVIRSYRGQRGLSQGDIERRTGLLRCYLSRVENGHTVPSLETLARKSRKPWTSASPISFRHRDPRDRDTQRCSATRGRVALPGEIKRHASTLSDGDKQLVLAMIRKMASMIPPPPPPPRKPVARAAAFLANFPRRPIPAACPGTRCARMVPVPGVLSCFASREDGRVVSQSELLRAGRGSRGRVELYFTNGCFDLIHPGHIESGVLAPLGMAGRWRRRRHAARAR